MLTKPTSRPTSEVPPPSHSDIRLLCRVLAREAEKPPPVVGDFKDLVAIAEYERVLPALHDAMSGRGTDIPKMWRAPLAVRQEMNRQRNRMIRNSLLELGAEAGKQGIDLIVLKGAAWVLEDTVGCAAWRAMTDLDLLVDGAHFPAMPGLLRQLGYERTTDAERFRVNFHHAPYRRRGSDLYVEVHRHLGWRHNLLPPEIVRADARPVAAGLALPPPWCRAFHTIIHWQIQDAGLQRRSICLKDMIDLARFMGRDDVDWVRLAAHARAVGVIEACEAAVALTSALLGGPVPREIEIGDLGAKHVAQALAWRGSPIRTWWATQIWRAGTLWHCEKVAYRASMRGRSAPIVHTMLWASRLARLPVLAVRATGIAAKGLVLSLRERRRV
jgi:Uncharacterised nucleotidyltransferase